MAVTQRPESTALARFSDVSGMIVDTHRERLTPLVPRGDSLERIARVVELEFRKNPELMKCDPVSVVDSVSRIMKWGLEPGETAYLVPYGNKCQAIRGVQGLIQLMYDSGHVRGVDVHVVYEKDHYEEEQGLHPILKHVPAFVKDRGPMVRVYCVIRLPFQHQVFRSFSLEEVEAIRQTYSKQWKKGPMPKWYMEKTAVIHTAKYLPKSSKFAAIHEAARREEESETIDVDAHVERPESVDTDGVDLTYDDTPTETVPVRPADKDLAWAEAYILPGKPTAWGGKGGQPLGTLSLSLLSSVQTWAAGQMEKPDGYAKADELEHAATIVMESRVADNESADVFGEGNLGAVLPGEVEGERAAKGELPLGDTRKAKNAVAEGR